MTIEIMYTVANIDDDLENAEVFLHTISKKRAERLLKVLKSMKLEKWKFLQIIPHELDEPVWKVDLKYPDIDEPIDTIIVGEPKQYDSIDECIVLKQKRIV